jgi:hypothetical protein
MVAMTDALAGQVVREPPDPLVELGVGAALMADHECLPTRDGVGGHLPDRREVEIRGC